MSLGLPGITSRGGHASHGIGMISILTTESNWHKDQIRAKQLLWGHSSLMKENEINFSPQPYGRFIAPTSKRTASYIVYTDTLYISEIWIDYQKPTYFRFLRFYCSFLYRSRFCFYCEMVCICWMAIKNQKQEEENEDKPMFAYCDL